MKKTMIISLAAAAMFAVVCSISVLSVAQETRLVKPLRVGVYDSRCVMVAYVHSEFSKNEI